MEKPILEEGRRSDLILVYDSINDKNKFNLQDHFKSFLKSRQKIRKSQTKSSILKDINASSHRNSQERMDWLRQKFIERGIYYMGVPYSKLYIKEDNPLYHSPMFLDCCGLIRQCVNDLSEDFGFSLGRWNQAYQYDILDEEVNFSALKPGDLIFYSAKYYKEKGWKAQLHDIVHVEIYMGNEEMPERSLAAREKNGVVGYFDTYKFTSSNYYDIKYIFKSIDPWLKGISTSYCTEHKWNDVLAESHNTNKYSLFDSAEAEDQ